MKDATSAGGFDSEIEVIKELAKIGGVAVEQAAEAEERLAKHKELEQEAKNLKARIKATKKREQELAEAGQSLTQIAQSFQMTKPTFSKPRVHTSPRFQGFSRGSSDCNAIVVSRFPPLS